MMATLTAVMAVTQAARLKVDAPILTQVGVLRLLVVTASGTVMLQLVGDLVMLIVCAEIPTEQHPILMVQHVCVAILGLMQFVEIFNAVIVTKIMASNATMVIRLTAMVVIRVARLKLVKSAETALKKVAKLAMMATPTLVTVVTQAARPRVALAQIQDGAGLLLEAGICAAAHVTDIAMQQVGARVTTEWVIGITMILMAV
jgi:hypothetical protein